MKLIRILAFIALALFFGCKKEVVTTTADYQINGLAQKGPFITGSKINISEFNANLTETGRNFSSTITDDKGTFDLKIQGLASSFIGVSVDGFYFDEVGGALSTSRLILNAVVDLASNPKINVNVLTHLTSERIKYLVAKGTPFAQAKAQAEKETLKIFVIDNSTKGFENLDISQGGTDNAILLAISAILQGGHSVAQLTELLTKISLDIKEDGSLNSEELKTDLINEAQLLKTAKVRENISKRYKDLNVTATIDAFEPYLENFIKKSGYTFTRKIEFPMLGTNGKPNILAMSDTTFITNTVTNLSLSAVLPTGTTLKLVVIPDTGTYSGFGADYLNSTWTIGSQNNLTTWSTNSTSSIPISVDPYSLNNSQTGFMIEVYQNGESLPSKKIKIFVTDLPSSFSSEIKGKFGFNFLRFNNSSSSIYNYAKNNLSIQLALNDVTTHETVMIINYKSESINNVNFVNAEGWSIIKESTPNDKYLYRATLTLKTAKGNADVQVGLAGTGELRSFGTIDGVDKLALRRYYQWH